MFESFVIMLREGIEAALVIGIIMVVLKRTARRDLERPVWWGLGLAVLASIGAAVALNLMPISDEIYEGTLYWVSAAFVVSMMWWMHRKSRTLSAEIEKRVKRAVESTASGAGRREAWGLGAFAFLMVFREGAETVLFLSAVNLTTEAMLGFIGTVLGLAAAVVFGVMFVKGSLKVNLRRFFTVTELVLGIFVVQLVINGYHEFSEIGILPATQRSMALVGPVVRNNTLFIIALVAVPLFIWLTKKREGVESAAMLSGADERLAASRAKRDRFYRFGAVASSFLVLISVGVVYARESMPKQVPAPEPVSLEHGTVVIPLEKLEDGKLHRFGIMLDGRMVRFLVMKTADGKYRTTMDACEICGAFGYIHNEKSGNLVCLNCGAEIATGTLGNSGGCNPIPLESKVTSSGVSVTVRDLEKEAHRFTDNKEQAAVDPVCGMRVAMKEAGGSETYKGKTYYFCSMPGSKCRGLFKENPAKFVQ